MTRKHRFKVDKLIRDKIPEIMRSYGVTITERIMEKDEYIKRLQDKLIEEAQEVVEAKAIDDIKEELADLLEVIISLGHVHGTSFDEIEVKRHQKKLINGGFDSRIYSGEYFDVPPDTASFNYYKAQPIKYPEIKVDNNKHIHVLSRAVIIDDGHILLCKTLDLQSNFYFLPGGHVEHGESVEKALLRELLEESGAVCTIKRLLGCLEHSFEPGRLSTCHNHEYNFIFEVTSDSLKKNNQIPQLEEHIQLMWIPLYQIAEIAFFPELLKTLIPNWLNSSDENSRFHSQMINLPSNLSD